MASAVRAWTERGQVRIGAEQAIDGGQAGQGLALVDGTGGVLHQVRERGAEIVELVGEVGVAELVGRGGCVGDRGGAGDDDVDWNVERLASAAMPWAEGRGDRRLELVLSGVEASGVSVMVSVVDCPTASETGASPVSVRPEGSVSVSVMLSRPRCRRS